MAGDVPAGEPNSLSGHAIIAGFGVPGRGRRGPCRGAKFRLLLSN